MITFVLHQLSVARRGEGGEHITLPHPGRRGARRREGQVRVSRASRDPSLEPPLRMRRCVTARWPRPCATWWAACGWSTCCRRARRACARRRSAAS